MGRYLARRLAQAGLVLLGVSAVVFALLHLSGDPAALLLPPDVPAEELQRFRRDMGFEDPLPVQFGRFLRGVAAGEFGRSLRHGEPAMALVLVRLPATAALALAAMALAVPLGVAAAVRRGRSPRGPAPRALRPDAWTWLGLALVVGGILAASFPGALAPFDPAAQDTAHRLQPPLWRDPAGNLHLLGTDQLGRDIWSRLVHGAWVSLAIAVVAVAIAETLGLAFGRARGIFGGGWTSP